MEVLCTKRAYVMKKIGDAHPDPNMAKCGQVTWSKHGGPAAAWEVAKARAHFKC